MANNVDLYRQMLWDARKVADKTLAHLVQKRLSPYLKTNPERCPKIIPFPTQPAGKTYVYPEDT